MKIEMTAELHSMFKPLSNLEDIAINAERARACCNLAIDAFECEIKHLPNESGYLSEVLLALMLASDTYYEAEKKLDETIKELFTVYKQLSEMNSEARNN